MFWKNKKFGFIQIPIISAIIVGILVLGGVGYVGAKKYQNYQAEKNKKEKEAQIEAEAQLKALEVAQREIEKLKIESEQSKNQQKAIEQKVDQVTSRPKEIIISSSDIAPLLGGMVNVSCSGGEGSGTLWNLPTIGYVVLTNQHVIEKPHYTIYDGYFCLASLEGGLYTISTQEKFTWNKLTDIAAVPLKKMDTTKFTVKPIKDLNYKISSLNKCPTNMPLGSPVVMVGFPAFAGSQTDLGSINIDQSFLTVTNGIISAHDTSVKEPFGGLPYVNYFVSAKIDSGNSGGIAFSKNNNGVCVLGVPTWLTVGNYETQGLIQNIHNVLYRD